MLLSLLHAKMEPLLVIFYSLIYDVMVAFPSNKLKEVYKITRQKKEKENRLIGKTDSCTFRSHICIASWRMMGCGGKETHLHALNNTMCSFP